MVGCLTGSVPHASHPVPLADVARPRPDVLPSVGAAEDAAAVPHPVDPLTHEDVPVRPGVDTVALLFFQRCHNKVTITQELFWRQREHLGRVWPASASINEEVLRRGEEDSANDWLSFPPWCRGDVDQVCPRRVSRNIFGGVARAAWRTIRAPIGRTPAFDVDIYACTTQWRVRLLLRY